MQAKTGAKTAKIGMVGLAVMGENLALNIARNGFPIAVFNRDTKKVDKFLKRAEGHQVIGAYSIEEFVNSLETPRKIILLVKAGKPVDDVIAQLKPLLNPGDIIIDGGNSFFQDTQRREKELKESRPQLHRLRRFGRRSRRALGALADAGRRSGGLRTDSPDLGSDRRKGRRRPLCHLHRTRRRGPLRQDGPQRHRVRRYAIDRRSLRHPATGARSAAHRSWPTSSPAGMKALSTHF